METLVLYEAKKRSTGKTMFNGLVLSMAFWKTSHYPVKEIVQWSDDDWKRFYVTTARGDLKEQSLDAWYSFASKMNYVIVIPQLFYDYTETMTEHIKGVKNETS